MTRFAADRDLVPVRREGVLGRVVAFGDLAGVTVRAHEVPVLRTPGPVQFVAEIDLLVRVLPEPALAARFLGPRIPGQRERLQASARQLDQVLLQRLDAEGVLDFEVGELAVGAVGADEEPAVAREEVRCNALVGELRVAEVAAHGLRGRVLHGARVLRRGPCGVLLRVTGLAGRTAGKARDDRCCAGGAWRRRGRCARQLPRDRGEQEPGRECGEHPGPARRRAGLAALASRRRRGDRSGGRAVGLAFLLTGETTNCGCAESFGACYGPLAVDPASAISCIGLRAAVPRARSAGAQQPGGDFVRRRLECSEGRPCGRLCRLTSD